MTTLVKTVKILISKKKMTSIFYKVKYHVETTTKEEENCKNRLKVYNFVIVYTVFRSSRGSYFLSCYHNPNGYVIFFLDKVVSPFCLEVHVSFTTNSSKSVQSINIFRSL